jgi:predicted small integral membrane protein
MSWMAWTKPTAIFFACIAVMLIAMTVWELLSPTAQRRGVLPMATTRGDRLFIGLLTAAFVHIAWIGLTTMTPWVAVAISAALMILIGLWG